MPDSDNSLKNHVETSTKRLVIIPARAGSTRLAHKHQRNLNGYPLIHYTFETAIALKNDGHVDDVVLSTDSPDLAKLALGYSIPLSGNRLRPQHLAQADTPTIDVLRWVIKQHVSDIELATTTIILLQPTSPLRTTAHVIDALSLLPEVPDDHSLVSVSPCKPVQWQGSIYGPTQRFQMCSPTCSTSPYRNAPPDDLSQHVVLNGAIYMALASELLEKNFLDMPSIAYVMSPETSIDVDNESDFLMAEALLQHRQITHQIMLENQNSKNSAQLRTVLRRVSQASSRPIHLRSGGAFARSPKTTEASTLPTPSPTPVETQTGPSRL
jgi:CMP-N,N'-diacetyllegionaminic acid synthase